MARAVEPLPVLLGSRPLARDEPTKRRRPAPAALELAEEFVQATNSLPQLRIKNTFIEGVPPLSPSIDAFYRERAVHTCPSKHVGRCISLLEELSAETVEAPAGTPLNIQTPCYAQTPVGNGLLLRQAACHERLEPPYVGAGYASFAQGELPTEVSAGAVAACSVAQPAYPMPSSLLQEGKRDPRAVLSLADFLEQQEPLGHGAQEQQRQQQPQQQLQQQQQQLQQQLGAAAVSSLLAAQQIYPALVGGQQGWGCPVGGGSGGAGFLDSAPPPYAPPAMRQEELGGSACKPPSGPALGSPELPSAGSAGHGRGVCKPCAFVHTKGCGNGLACQFCHLCGPEIRKMRRQEKLHQRREAQRVRKEKQTLRQSSSF